MAPHSPINASAGGASLGAAGSCGRLCDIRDWQNPDFLAVAADLMCTSRDAVPVHRKIWEFARVIQALQAHDLWHGEAVGLSVAGGRERFLFYAANHLARIVSTDIYGIGSFADREADERFLANPGAYAPFPFHEENLRAARMNAAHLLFPDNMFDFTVSFSSIEHFGGLRAAKRAVREMVRVTRPGGLIAITTEYSLNGFTTNEVFAKEDIMELTAASECEAAGPMDLTISDDSKRYLLDMLKDDLAQLPHLNLKLHAAIFTSLCLVLRKPASRPATGSASSLAERLAAVDAALSAAQTVSADELAPRRSILTRIAARIYCAVRRMRYRCQERLLDYRSY